MSNPKLKSEILKLAAIAAVGLLAYLAFTDKASGSPTIIKKIEQSARKHKVDPDLAVAIATVESNLNHKAVGTSGEKGLFQLHPRYHNPSTGDLDRHIDTAIQYLARVRTLCAPRMGDAAFVCFNRGPYTKITEPRKTDYYKRVTEALYRSRAEKRNVTIERLPYDGR